MRPSLAFLLISVAAWGQTVRLHGRVYNTKDKSAAIERVTVTVDVGGKELQKLTGRDGTYTFENLAAGDAVLKFEKETWQPHPRTDYVTLKSANEVHDADLFQPINENDILASIKRKVYIVNVETKDSDPTVAASMLANEWRSCLQADMAAHFKTSCAKSLLEISGQGIAAPNNLHTWANVDPKVLIGLESQLKLPALLTKSPGDFESFTAHGIPPGVVYDQIHYELTHSSASDAEKAALEAKAKTGLKLSDKFQLDTPNAGRPKIPQ